MNSNFENLPDLLLRCSNCFNIICVTETWSTDKEFENNLNTHLANFNFISQKRKIEKKRVAFLHILRMI